MGVHPPEQRTAKRRPAGGRSRGPRRAATLSMQARHIQQLRLHIRRATCRAVEPRGRRATVQGSPRPAAPGASARQRGASRSARAGSRREGGRARPCGAPRSGGPLSAATGEGRQARGRSPPPGCATRASRRHRHAIRRQPWVAGWRPAGSGRPRSSGSPGRTATTTGVAGGRRASPSGSACWPTPARGRHRDEGFSRTQRLRGPDPGNGAVPARRRRRRSFGVREGDSPASVPSTTNWNLGSFLGPAPAAPSQHGVRRVEQHDLPEAPVLVGKPAKTGPDLDEPASAWRQERAERDAVALVLVASSRPEEVAVSRGSQAESVVASSGSAAGLIHCRARRSTATRVIHRNTKS